MAPDFSQDLIKSSKERDSSSASGPARSAIVARRRGLVNRRDIISQVEFGAQSPVGRIESDFVQYKADPSQATRAIRRRDIWMSSK